MIFADHALAARLEGFDARLGADCAHARRRLRPGADTAVLAVAGGFALFSGEDSPLTEAKGLGMAGPVSPADLDAMERVFRDRGVPAKVLVCSMADPSLLGGLADRGFRPVGFEDMLYREIEPGEGFPSTPPGIEIARAGPDEVETLGLTLARGFVAPGEPGPEMLEIFGAMAEVEGTVGFLARSEGAAAGGASLAIRKGIALLAGASTLPIYRNRGIQSALANARLAEAVRAGCLLSAMVAEPGTPSHRNAERLGFRVAYTKLVLIGESP